MLSSLFASITQAEESDAPAVKSGRHIVTYKFAPRLRILVRLAVINLVGQTPPCRMKMYIHICTPMTQLEKERAYRSIRKRNMYKCFMLRLNACFLQLRAVAS